jgi:hypothetical protein
MASERQSAAGSCQKVGIACGGVVNKKAVKVENLSLLLKIG